MLHDRAGGRGVSKQRLTIDQGPNRLLPWFAALADRLASVVVLNRDWSSAVTPTVLADTPSGAGDRINRCVFLDPPYRTDERSTDIYNSDYEGTSDDAAVQAFEWAKANGDRYRIAYACHAGDFEVPEGWEAETLTFGGHRVNREGRVQDMVMFSPACLIDPPQPTLFG